MDRSHGRQQIYKTNYFHKYQKELGLEAAKNQSTVIIITKKTKRYLKKQEINPRKW